MACVYGHYQPKTKKWYIGIVLGNKPPQKRWGKNGYCYTRFNKGKPEHPKFRNAILKYGWDSFNHLILCDGLTDEEAKKKEVEFIKLFNSQKNGYNCTKGGDGVVGYKHTATSKKKMSQACIARNAQENLRLARIGVPSAISKPVLCVETGEVFVSARSASISIHLNPDAIKTAIHRNGTCNGYHWKYIK